MAGVTITEKRDFRGSDSPRDVFILAINRNALAVMFQKHNKDLHAGDRGRQEIVDAVTWALGNPAADISVRDDDPGNLTIQVVVDFNANVPHPDAPTLAAALEKAGCQWPRPEAPVEDIAVTEEVAEGTKSRRKKD